MQILHVQSLNSNVRLTTAFTLKLLSALGYSRKNPNRGLWVEYMEYHRSWFFALEFSRGATQLCRISKGEVLLSLEFPRVKWANGLFQKKTNNQGRSRKWNFQGYQRNSMWNFQGSIKIEVKFPGFPAWICSGIAHLGVCLCTEISHWKMKCFIC